MIALLLPLAWAEPPPIERPDWCERAQALGPDDRRWCSSPPPDCPAFEKACAATRTASASGGCGGEPERGRAEPEPVPLPDVPVGVVALPGCEAAIGGLGWGALGVVLALVVLALLRRVAAPGDEAGEGGELARLEEPEGGPVVQPDGGDWLAAARRAADAGRLGEALLLARAAAVRGLESRGRLDPDPSRTDREVLRGLANDPATRDDLRVVMGALERVRYAGGSVDRGTVERALTAAAKVLARLSVVGLLSLLAAPAHASPKDHDLLVPTLRAAGVEVLESDHIDADAGTQLWFPGSSWTDAELELAVAAAEEGASVVIVGTTFAASLPLEGVVFTGACSGVIRPVVWLGGVAAWPPLRLPPRSGTCVQAPLGSSLLLDEQGGAAATEIAVGDGFLVLVTVPALFEDASLLHPDNRAALVALLALKAEVPVTLVTPTLRTPPATEQVMAAGFTAFILQLGLLWVLWAWRGGRSFAPRVAPMGGQNRHFTDHLAAVARFFRARGSSEVGFVAVSRRALLRLERLAGVGGEALAPRVAARTGQPLDLVSRLIDRARAAPDSPGADTSEHLYLVEALWKLVTLMQTANSPHSPGPSKP